MYIIYTTIHLLLYIYIGTVHAAVVTPLHSAFQRMQIIPAHSADDHLMSTVREGMRSALFQHRLATPCPETNTEITPNTSNIQTNQNNMHQTSINSSETMPIPVQNKSFTTSTIEITQNSEQKKKFETVFDIPLYGAHRYYPPAGTGPSLHNMSKSKQCSSSTASGSGSSAAVAVAVGDPGNTPKIGAEAIHNSSTGNNVPATTTSAPPKIVSNVNCIDAALSCYYLLMVYI